MIFCSLAVSYCPALLSVNLRICNSDMLRLYFHGINIYATKLKSIKDIKLEPFFSKILGWRYSFTPGNALQYFIHHNFFWLESRGIVLWRSWEIYVKCSFVLIELEPLVETHVKCLGGDTFSSPWKPITYRHKCSMDDPSRKKIGALGSHRSRYIHHGGASQELVEHILWPEADVFLFLAFADHETGEIERSSIDRK